MDIIQKFYDNMASHYEKLFLDWESATCEQAKILSGLFADKGFGKSAKVLDCACGIGTQSIGLARLGHNVTASDVSDAELARAQMHAEETGVNINFLNADFRKLSETFDEDFDIIICMDNALPHMLTPNDMAQAVRSITSRLSQGGIFVASIRDYDEILKTKPSYSPPYIHKTEKGQRVSFQTWDWNGDNYRLTQYIIDDEDSLQANKFECEYRAVCREELTSLLLESGCTEAEWKFPAETGFYQPIVIARK